MASLTDQSGRPFSGLVSHAVVGIVDDNVDPDRLARIRVKFPTLPPHADGEEKSWWLRIASPNAGKERGFYALPEIGDEVLVLFLQGTHEEGVIIGQFWNGEDKPPTEAEDGMPGSGKTDTGGKKSKDKFADGSTSIDDNDRRFWRSRSGHLFVFDDTSGSETIQVWDGAHKLAFVFDTSNERIILSNSGGDIHIRAKNDLYLEAGNDILYQAGNNVEGDAGTDFKLKAGANYSIESGADTKIKAGANLKAEAGANLDLKAGANLTISGVMVEAKGSATAKVEGSATCTVKGGMVMIN